LTHFSFTFTSVARCSAANNGVHDGVASHLRFPVAARRQRHAMVRRASPPPKCSFSSLKEMKRRPAVRASPKGCEKIDAKTMYWGLC
jgi:hypothetical protein